MEKNVYVFGGKTAKFKATKRYVCFENFPSFIHCSDSSEYWFLGSLVLGKENLLNAEPIVPIVRLVYLPKDYLCISSIDSFHL